jgi:hypothetical protein
LLDERCRIEQDLAIPGGDGDRARLVKLAQDRASIVRRVAEVESAWIEASEQLEARIAEQQDID